jgi:hypothetical protein
MRGNCFFSRLKPRPWGRHHSRRTDRRFFLISIEWLPLAHSVDICLSAFAPLLGANRAGVELIGETRKRFPDIEIMAISALGDEETEGKQKGSGGSGRGPVGKQWGTTEYPNLNSLIP